MPSSCAHGLRSAGDLDDRLRRRGAASCRRGRPSRSTPARRDVLAHLHRAAAPAKPCVGELVVQLGVDEVHLAQVGLRRVAAARASGA